MNAVRRRRLAALAAALPLVIGVLTAVPAAAAQKDEPQATAPVNVDRTPDGLTYLPQSIDQYATTDDGSGDRLSVTLVWSLPTGSAQYTDYAIWRSQKDHGTSTFSPATQVGLASRNPGSPANRAFGVFYSDPANAHAVKAVNHNFVATDLHRGTDYRFEVRGVHRDGTQRALGTAYTVPLLAMPADAPQRFVVTADGYAGIPGTPSPADGGNLVFTQALQKAIDDAGSFAATGTGRSAEVDIPAGTVLRSGAINLRSGVTLRVDGTLEATLDISQFVPTGSGFTATNGNKFLNLINVNGTSKTHLHDVRIVGTGTVDGQGWQYRTDGAPNVEYAGKLGLTESKRSGWDTIEQNGLLAKAVYQYCTSAGGQGGNGTCYGKRPNLIAGTQVDNLYIGGIRAQNPANSLSGFSYVTNYVVNGITAQTFNTNNGDSINVSRFKGFTVLNNVINSGDDNVVMNSYSSSEYERGGAAAVAGSAWVFDNYLARGHGGTAFGSGTSGWIDNVVIEDNVYVGTSDAIRAKSKPGAGGGVRFVTVRRLAMRDLTNLVDGKVDPLVLGYQMDGAPFIFTTHYPGDYSNVRWPSYHDWDISQVSVDGSRTAGIIVDGLHDDAKLAAAGLAFIASNNLHFRDVHFRGTGVPRIDYLRDSTFDDVTFETADGRAITDPWTSTNQADGVTADGRPIPSGNRTFAVTSGAGGRVSPDDAGLTVVTTGSFERFYTNVLPDESLARVGTIAIDGVPLADDQYPRFATKADDFAVLPGTDAQVAISPQYVSNVNTVVTLRKPLISGLTTGAHHLTIQFQNGTAETTFTVLPAAAGTH
ncbi:MULTISPECIES: glycoside hydrolase family 28 protein [Kribbella]|uniref:Polygalacturonase n=1 Tax=Kribbella karoonensis TaxID=324851 RepID=A0ABP4PXZ0_9ACTN